MSSLERLAVQPIEEGSDQQNEVHMYSRGKTLQYQGLFSFSFYFHKTDKAIQDTHWYRGLNLYLQMVHNPSYPFYKDVGIVIYTDLHTFHILKELDVWKIYPKLIFAVTIWKRYQKEPNKMEETVMRCMRYHSLQAFPGTWIAIRDADTLFQEEIGLRTTRFGTQYLVDMKPTLPEQIAVWEETFLKLFQSSIQQPICIGVGMYYQRPWHTNMSRDYVVRVDKLIYEKYQLNEHPNTRKNLIFASKYGAYAGFVTCKSERPADLWKYIVKYLVQRYKIVIYKNKHMISDALYSQHSVGKDERILLFSILPYYLDLCYFFVLSSNMGEYSVGNFYEQSWKMSRNKYNEVSKDFQKLPLLNPASLIQVITYNSHDIFYKYFKTQMEEYKKWYDSFDEMESQHKQRFLSKLQKVKPGYENLVNLPYEIPMVPVRESNIFLETSNQTEKPINTMNLKNQYNTPKNNATSVASVPNVGLEAQPQVSKNNAVPTVPEVKQKRCTAGKCTVMGGRRQTLLNGNYVITRKSGYRTQKARQGRRKTRKQRN